MAARFRTTHAIPRTLRSLSSAFSPAISPRPGFHSPQVQPQLRRTMADASRPAITAPPAGKYEFLIVMPDKPGMQQKRLEVRPKHFEGLQALIDSGTFKMGGAALNDNPEGSDATKWDFYGSTLVMVAASKEECLEVLRKDIYTTSGVWDIEKAQIWPVKLAFRYP